MLLKPWRLSEPPCRMSWDVRLTALSSGHSCILSILAEKPTWPPIRAKKLPLSFREFSTTAESC